MLGKYLIIALIIIEYYSIGVTFFAKKAGMKNYALNALPFFAFFTVQKYTKGFGIFVISVKKWGETVIILFLVSLVSIFIGDVGEGYFSEEQSTALKQITYIPVAVCAVIFWLGMVFSSKKIIEIDDGEFPCYSLICAMVLPIPFLLSLAGKVQNRLDKRSYK